MVQTVFQIIISIEYFLSVWAAMIIVMAKKRYHTFILYEFYAKTEETLSNKPELSKTNLFAYSF